MVVLCSAKYKRDIVSIDKIDRQRDGVLEGQNGMDAPARYIDDLSGKLHAFHPSDLRMSQKGHNRLIPFIGIPIILIKVVGDLLRIHIMREDHPMLASA